MSLIWAGYVQIWLDAKGHKTIRYSQDDVDCGNVYEPDSYFSRKAVDALVEKLTKPKTS